MTEPVVQDLGGGYEALVGQMQAEMVELKENYSNSITELVLAIDDIGWKKLTGMDDGKELPLESLKEYADGCRALATANPIIKRGVAVRTSYVWGQGVDLVGQTKKKSTEGEDRATGPSSGGSDPSWNNTSLKRSLTTSLAQYELERALATDGNVLLLVDTVSKRVQRIPLDQVTATVANPEDDEDVWFYRRTWEVKDNLNPDRPGTPKERQVYYPSYDLYSDHDGDEVRSAVFGISQIGRDEVDNEKVLLHLAVNRMTGWTWGIPDIFTSIFWVRAYKEYLEDCKKLLKAYAQFAWKFTSASGNGKAQSKVAQKLATPAQRDPLTGEYANIGGGFVLPPGLDMTAVGKNSGNVNMREGRELAALVAAGLEIPLPVLLSDPTGNAANSESLEPVTASAMRARQLAWDAIGEQVADLLGFEWDVSWPPVHQDPPHRMVQAVSQADATGTLHKEEVRGVLLRILDIEGDPNKVPEPEVDPMLLAAGGQPGPGGQTKQPEPPSYGDHELRDEGTQAHTD